MRVINPPDSFDHIDDNETFSVYLAGSYGNTTWRQVLKQDLKIYDLIVLDPFVENWDKSIQKNVVDSRYVQQAQWEFLAALNASLVVFFFDATGDSSSNLLHLGMLSSKNNVVVCFTADCPDRSSIEIFCQRMKVKYVTSLENLSLFIKTVAHNVNIPRCKN